MRPAANLSNCGHFIYAKVAFLPAKRQFKVPAADREWGDICKTGKRAANRSTDNFVVTLTLALVVHSHCRRRRRRIAGLLLGQLGQLVKINKFQRMSGLWTLRTLD